MNKPLIKSLVLICCIAIIFISCNDSKNSSKEKPAESTKEAKAIIEDSPKSSEIVEATNCCINVDADKTNILYIGVDNPITIHAPDEVEISLSGEGTINKGDSAGKYTVNVTGGPEAYIIIKHLSDASCRAYKKYTVKKLPNPIATLGTLKDNDSAATSTIRALATKLFAKLENRDLSARFTIVSYTFVLINRTRSLTVTSNGSNITTEINRCISSLRAGDKIIFQNIRASGPDGIRLLNSIVITAK